MPPRTSEKAFRVSITDLETGKITTITVYTTALANDRDVALDVQLSMQSRGYRTTDVDDKRHKRR